MVGPIIPPNGVVVSSVTPTLEFFSRARRIPLTNMTFSLVTPSGPTQLFSSVNVRSYYRLRVSSLQNEHGDFSLTFLTTPVVGVSSS